MTPAEYEAHFRAWKAKETRWQRRFAMLATVTAASKGCRVSVEDFMAEFSEEE
jgi:hypothetical protein